ncbi:ABC transporter ATP-binding protein [Chloroflexi bacterium TSY]|nr:ABC transporter ATP-binding protein [Chloroflexi bacterium TSY]
MSENVLAVENLKTHFFTDEGILRALDGVSFRIGKQETLGVIGESGCGKSVTAQSVLRIVPSPGRIVDGSAWLYTNGGQPQDLLQMNPAGEEIRDIRGKEISMIFQEPMTSLSPVHTVGNQIEEAILMHKTQEKAEAREIAFDMLDRVGIPNPVERAKAYPFQLSGGMRQRVMIAMALSCNPKLLFADEPTTALDVTVQAQILELMKALQEQFGMSVMFITHDLGVIAEIADRVVVMYLGRVVESAPVKELFRNPLHPYTANLLKSIPRVGKQRGERLQTIRGTVPIPLDLPRECPFLPRCDQAIPGVCDKEIPALEAVAEKHAVRCYLHHQKDEVVQGV